MYGLAKLGFAFAQDSRARRPTGSKGSDSNSRHVEIPGRGQEDKFHRGANSVSVVRFCAWRQGRDDAQLLSRAASQRLRAGEGERRSRARHYVNGRTVNQSVSHPVVKFEKEYLAGCFVRRPNWRRSWCGDGLFMIAGLTTSKYRRGFKPENL